MKSNFWKNPREQVNRRLCIADKKTHVTYMRHHKKVKQEPIQKDWKDKENITRKSNSHWKYTDYMNCVHNTFII
jgi:hypothetical protein